jgi:tRNA modification GTPase
MGSAAGRQAPADTIAAIATAAGNAAIGVVRISGPQTPAIAESILGRTPAPRHATYSGFLDADGKVIDRGIAIFFPAPNSVTGEDILELQAHGGHVLLHLLLARVLQLGARLARPGEFSERAFFNEKIDLAQAEAIADLISANTEHAARAASASLQGEFSRRVEAMANAIDALRAEIEACLDFPDEEPERIANRDFKGRTVAILAQIDSTLRAARAGQLLHDGISVVLLGRPNAGKSSLFNCLVGRERAIVSPHPGTTRDTLEALIDLDGLSVELTDTAGLRETADDIEREGIRRAEGAAAAAQQVLLLIPADEDYDATDSDLLARLDPGTPVTVVRTKLDRLEHAPAAVAERVPTEIHVSTHTQQGIDVLARRIQQACGYGAEQEGAFTARRRHVEALTAVRAAVQAAIPLLAAASDLELAAEHLRQARRHLSVITGAYTTEDLLGQIFSTFCIGK